MSNRLVTMQDMQSNNAWRRQARVLDRGEMMALRREATGLVDREFIAVPTNTSQWDVSSPVANTTYSFPRDPDTGLPIPLYVTAYSVHEFRIFADQPCTVQIYESDNGVDYYPVEGAYISSTDFKTDRWNWILTNKPLIYAQIRVMTGATAPSTIKTRYIGRG
ncbi:MAG: hypothetical protein QXG12_02210 [Thermoproteota archaeon]